MFYALSPLVSGFQLLVFSNRINKYFYKARCLAILIEKKHGFEKARLWTATSRPTEYNAFSIVLLKKQVVSSYFEREAFQELSTYRD